MLTVRHLNGSLAGSATLIGQLIAPYRILRPRSAAIVGNVFADAAKGA